MKKFIFFLVIISALVLTGCRDNKILIKFNTNGGTEISDQELRFKEVDPALFPVPTKEGHTFKGWFLDEELTKSVLENRIPNQDTTVYAAWEINSYKIYYHTDGGTEISSTTHSYASTITLPSNPTKENYEFKGWFEDAELTQKFERTTMPSHDLNLYAKWEPQGYKITFETGLDDLSVEPRYFIEGADISLPELVHTNYEFLGWYLDEERTITFDLTKMPAENITLYAAWEIKTTTYTIEHYIENANDNDYTLYETYQMNELVGEIVEADLLTIDWIYENTDHPNRLISGEVLGDGTLVLRRYYYRTQYTIIVKGNGGVDENGNPQVIINAKYEETLTPPTLTYKGHLLIGWNPAFPTNMPHYNLEIGALWEEVRVTYQIEYYQEAIDTSEYVLIETVSAEDLIDYEVEAQVKNYLGFTLNEEHPNSKLTAVLDYDLVLRVYYIRNIYAITFKGDDGSNLDIEPIWAKYGAPISTDVTHEKEGHVFIGWYTSLSAEEPYQFTTMPYGGLTLYARFQVALYTITFVSNAEISVNAITAEYNTPIQAPSNPVRPGYTFLGWFEDEECTIPYYFTVMPALNITLYAAWEPMQVTITFIYNDGRPNTDITGYVGDEIDEIIPEREGYTFGAWYYDPLFEEEFTEWVLPIQSSNIYAEWIPNNYTITFVTGVDDLVVDPITAPYESYVELPVLSLMEYDFVGWFLDPEFDRPFNDSVMPLNGATLYAKWEAADDRSLISYALSREPGTIVNTRGYVYHLISDPYQGFYIYYGDFQILCLTDTVVNIGDEVLVNGYFERQNGLPIINGIISVTVLSENNVIPDSELVDITVFDELTYHDELFGRRYKIHGLLVSEREGTYLVDPVSQLRIRISRFNQMDTFIMSDEYYYYQGEFILASYDNGWIVNLVEGTLSEVILDSSEKARMIKDSLIYFAGETIFRPGTVLDIPYFDHYNWLEISMDISQEDQHLYDSDTGLLADLDEPYLLHIIFTIEDNPSFEVSYQVVPYEVTTIFDYFYNENVEDEYYLRGVVIRLSPYNAYIQDETGIFNFSYDSDMYHLELGADVLIRVNEYNEEYAFIEKIYSYETDLPKPRVITEADILDLPNNPHLFGEYVELRGVLDFEVIYEDVYDPDYSECICTLFIGNTVVRVVNDKNSMIHFRQFDNMEVVIRGYLILNYYGDMNILIFDNNRHDLRLPTYADSEVASMIQQSLVRELQEMMIFSYDKFILPRTNFLLGGDITWTLSGPAASYYDPETERFLNITEPTSLTINFVINYNGVIINFSINKVVYPAVYTRISDLPLVEDHEMVKVKGIVVFRHFDYFYLQDDSGIILVRSYGHSFLIGDEIRIEAEKKSEYTQTILELNIETDSWDVMSINNSNPLTPIGTTVKELSLLNPVDNLISGYYQVKGLLKYYNSFMLYAGDYCITIDTGDYYTYYELMEYVDKVVIINVYLGNYRPNGLWEVIYTGLPGEIEVSSYTDQEIIEFIKESLIDRYNKDYYVNSYHYFLSEHEIFGGQLEYEDLDPVDNPINFETGYISNVPADEKRKFKVYITYGDVEDEIELEFSIKVYTEDKEAEIVSIAEFKDSLGETKAIYAQVIGIYYDLVLVKDETGILYIKGMFITYYEYENTLNRYFTFVGKSEYHRGRYEMRLSSYATTSEFGEGESVNYEMTDISVITNYDHRDPDIFGKPVAVRGIVRYEEENYQYYYYLYDGFEKVRLDNDYHLKGGGLYNFIDQEVTIRGRIYGFASNGQSDTWIIGLDRYAIQSDQFSEEEIVYLVGNKIIRDYHNTVYDIYEEIYFYVDEGFFPNSSVTFYQVNGFEVVNFYGNSGIIYPTDEDYIVEFSVKVSCGSYTEYLTLEILIRGTALNSLDDLFEEEGGTIKVAVRGTLIHIVDGGGAYFSINDEVYFLENFISNRYDHYVGDTYMIIGYKTEIDGETNITYVVSVVSSFYEDYYLEPTDISIHQIYEADPLEIGRELLYVNGILKYEEVSNTYYLEHLGEKIYLRIASSMPVYKSITPQDLNMPEWLIGEEVIVACLFPNQYLRGKYILDIYGSPWDSIMEVEKTPQEQVESSINWIKNVFHQTVYHSFEEFYQQNYYEDVSLEWELVNESDAQYIIIDQYGYWKFTYQPETITILFQITATHNYNTYVPSMTTVIEIIVEPLPILPINELHRQISSEFYLIKGVVQEVIENEWILIRDETGLIFVESYGYNTTFSIGDEVLVYGSYSYDSYEPMPIIDYSSEIVVLSHGNPVSTPTPVEMSIEEVRKMNYLDPTTAYQYITIEGELSLSGYNYYTLVDGDYKIELVLSSESKDILYDLYGMGRIKLTGYIMGPNYVNSNSDWSMIFCGTYELIPETV